MAAATGVTHLDRLQGGLGAGWSWGFVAQGSSSATSLALSIIAGRALGAGGLGVVFTGFMAYLLVLNLHRGLVLTPLIASSSTGTPPDRLAMTRSALTSTLGVGAVATALMLAAGTALRGAAAEGLLVFAPWILPALVQDLLRACLFRDGLGRRAAAMDVSWLVAVVTLAPVSLSLGTTWAVVASWGAGALVAATVGSIWTKVVPSARAAEWFVRVALPFGRWLVVGEVIVNVGGYALVVTLTSIVGASDVGGLRAAETIFAPFSLLAMALSLPGLPAMSRALARGRGEAIRLAWTISVSGVLVTLAYLAVVLVAGTWVLTALFGASFEEYGSLIVPMSLWQLLLTIQVGFTILLRAQLRGSALALASASTVGVTLACATMLATAWGIGGAVWGMCVGVGVGCAVVIGLSIRSPSSAEADDGPLSRGLRADDIALRPGSTLGS